MKKATLFRQILQSVFIASGYFLKIYLHTSSQIDLFFIFIISVGNSSHKTLLNASHIGFPVATGGTANLILKQKP